MNQFIAEKLKVFEQKMVNIELPQIVIDNFKRYFTKLLEGDAGKIDCHQIDPIESVPLFSDLNEFQKLGEMNFDKVVMIKLNGGLGTSMGLDGPKSMLPVKNNMNFLDIIVNQKKMLEKRFNHSMPVIFMDSQNTATETIEYLNQNFDIDQKLPMDFLQHRVPKVNASTLLPVEYPDNPELEWAPPGHGDIYYALIYSGLLEKLQDQSKKYLFVSNSDNLGAVMDFSILGYIISRKIPFLMEVARRTEMDKKGGHLARFKNGDLTLREIAQCPENEKEDFENILKFKYFNTNTIWIDIDELITQLRENNKFLNLPLIKNEKNVDPTDSESQKIFQIETAMGAAISKFKRAEAIEVPRTRFRPVKTCEDLIGLWSDAYSIDDDCIIHLDSIRMEPPRIQLDKRYYKMISDIRRRFPHGSPSLKRCTKMLVYGDVVFGNDVELVGDVEIKNLSDHQTHIPDQTIIENEKYILK